MSVLPLVATVNVTFDANGNGSVYIGPQVYGETWDIKRISISTSSGPAATRFYLYLNTIQPSAQIDSTYSGDQDTSETNIHLQTLDKVYGSWTNGVVGAVGTMVVTGTKNTGR